MPRLQPALLNAARKLDRRLPGLLRATRDLESARAELRWLSAAFRDDDPRKLARACAKRARQYPLQYILGSQPFERLEVLCRPGVLIPRWETEEWAVKLAALVRGRHGLTVLDLCTGTGCIPMLMATAVHESALAGVDLSDQAVQLFKKNVQHNALLMNATNEISVVKADILENQGMNALNLPFQTVDLITANPPYIPTLHNPASLVERSVRLYEPKLALLGDNEFYTAIFNHATTLQAKALVCEVGEQYQIDHITGLAEHHNSSTALDEKWTYGQFNDASDNPRIAVLWKPSWSFLKPLCSNS